LARNNRWKMVNLKSQKKEERRPKRATFPQIVLIDQIFWHSRHSHNFTCSGEPT
jgi:hypothetical protein